MAAQKKTLPLIPRAACETSSTIPTAVLKKLLRLCFGISFGETALHLRRQKKLLKMNLLRQRLLA